MENKVCEVCKKPLEDNFNFCPYCGEPITEKAKLFNVRKGKNAQLRILIRIAEMTKDKDTLELLDNLRKKLK